MNAASSRPNPDIRLKIWMIISQLLAFGSLLIWGVFAFMSLLFFDAKASLQAFAPMIALWAYPILPIGFSIAAWVSYARRMTVWAAVFSGISAAPIFLACISILPLIAWR